MFQTIIPDFPHFCHASLLINMSQENLKDKTIKGAAWSAVDNISGYAVTFVVGLILARLLSPDDYGLIGIITIFTAICSCFINAGFSSALIRKNQVTEADYCTVFACNLLTSVFLYLALFITAPFIASFFSRNELTPLIRVQSLEMVIASFAIVQRTRLSKKIDFKSQAIVTITSNVLRSVVGLCMAFSGYGVWAIVGQSLTGTLMSTLLLCYFNRWVPRLYFSRNSFKELFGFGSKLLISDIINTLWNQCYSIVIGKYYKPATLGQYTRAIMFSGLLSNNMTYVIQRVTYPVLSEIQDDRVRLKNGYQRIIRVSMLISFFSMLMMAAVAQPMIIVLIGPKWIDASYYLQIICMGAMLYPLHSINLNILQIFGRSDLFLKLELYKKGIAVIPIILGITIGIYWMLVGSVIVSFISYIINAYYSGPLLDYSIKSQITDIMPCFLISLASSSASIGIYHFLEYLIVPQFSFWLNLAILVVTTLTGFLIALTLLKRSQRPEYQDIKYIIFRLLKNRS